jgi:hypothetical protein
MKDPGAEMAYMGCIWPLETLCGTIPGADSTFENFHEITGKQPTKWIDFIEKHKTELEY